MPLTLTEIVQDEFAASEPPLRLIVLVPAAAVTVPVQVEERELGVSITKPPGKTSVKLTPVRALEPDAVLFTVRLRVLELPVPILVGTNDLEMVGTGGVGQPLMTTSSKYNVAPVADGLPLY